MVVDVFLHILNFYNPDIKYEMPFFCDVYTVLKGACVKGSALIILAMASERFYAMYYPFKYRDTVTISMMVKVGIVCTVWGFVSACLTNLAYGINSGWCLEQRPNFNRTFVNIVVVASVVLYLILPSISTAILNVLIILKMKRRKTTGRR